MQSSGIAMGVVVGEGEGEGLSDASGEELASGEGAAEDDDSFDCPLHPASTPVRISIVVTAVARREASMPTTYR